MESVRKVLGLELVAGNLPAEDGKEKVVHKTSGFLSKF